MTDPTRSRRPARRRSLPAAATTVALLAGVLGAAPAAAATAEADPEARAAVRTPGAGWMVRAPGIRQGGPAAEVRHDAATGTVTLAVTRRGRTVVEPSPVGIVTEQADLSSGLRLLGRSSRQVVERYTTTVGKRLVRNTVMTEARFAFAGASGARVDLVVRASRAGVAYRYVLPENRGAVLRETSAFTLPAASPAWLALYRRDYENPFVPTTAGGAATAEYMHPALFESGGSYVLVTESDVDGRYSGGRLAHEAGSGRYTVKLWDERVAVDGPLATPWRTMIVGDLGTVASSTLVDDLARPSQVRDTSWIRPGKVFWSWLAGGREAGQSLRLQKTYVDYAAAHGWPYVLVDAGWYFDPNWEYDPAWERTSWIPDLVRYAAARRVDVQVWIHYDELDTAAERAVRLPLLRSWGVTGLKIDFMDSDAQERFRWYDQVLADTARHRLLVNFHGSTLPHGIHRTWPHVVTMEAVHGGEKSSNLTTTHLTSLPFTRNVPGSMDYTPMAWHRPSRPTSDAHELALSVLFESGVQNFAGRVDGYVARPEAERFLDQVPTVWDETRVLAGRPADSAVFARRSADRWFLGAGFAGAARTADVPFALPRGRWLVDLVRDATAPGATGLLRERRVLAAGDTLSVDVVKDGGFAAVACRWRPGVTTCDRPVRTVPATTVTAGPAKVSATPGASFEVGGELRIDDTYPLADVSLVPRVPAGWRVTGPPVRAGRLRPGQVLRGRWTVTAPAEPAFGYHDVPVVARFRPYDAWRDGRPVEDEQPVRVHLWRPLPAGWSYLSDRPSAGESNGQGPVERDTAVGGAAAGDGPGIAIRRVRYGKGLGTHAPAEVTFALGGACTELVTDVGVDDQAGLDVARTRVGGTAAFAVVADGVTRAQTGTLTPRDPARTLTVDLTGVRTLTLRVTDGGDGTLHDRASWGDARVRCPG
jgi:alpha-glucosidase